MFFRHFFRLSASLLIFFLHLLLISTSGFSNPKPMPAVAPDDAGFDPSTLDQAVELYRKAIEKEELHGAVLLIAHDGKILLHEALGWRDRENNLPMEPDTLFRMASNTKPVVTTALLLLAEEGKLSIEDSVADYISTFKKDRFSKITIEQLMTHSSGLPRGPILPQNLNSDSSLIEVAEHFGKTLELETDPGSSYAYSNSAYNILGGIIEKTSGERLDH